MSSLITAVIPTRGKLDERIWHRMPIDLGEMKISRGEGLWHRYQSAKQATYDLIYTQDDDCVVDVEALLGIWVRDGCEGVLCNMPAAKRPEYPDAIALVGWGCFFRKEALKVFDTYFQMYPKDELFVREADRVFTALNTVTLADVAVEHLPAAYGSDRMGAQGNHLASLGAIRQRIYDVRRSFPLTQPPGVYT